MLVGLYSTTLCSPCAPGKFSKTPDSTSCSPCAAGQFTILGGNTECCSPCAVTHPTIFRYPPWQWYRTLSQSKHRISAVARCPCPRGCCRYTGEAGRGYGGCWTYILIGMLVGGGWAGACGAGRASGFQPGECTFAFLILKLICYGCSCILVIFFESAGVGAVRECFSLWVPLPNSPLVCRPGITISYCGGGIDWAQVLLQCGGHGSGGLRFGAGKRVSAGGVYCFILGRVIALVWN